MRTNRPRAGRFGPIAFAIVAAALVTPAGAQNQATTCTVISNSDSGPGTLRQLLADPACAVIGFDAALTAIGVVTPLIIDRDVTVHGPWSLPDAYLDPDRRMILGFGSRVFEVSPGANAVISGLGYHATRAPFGGGVILNRGTLTVSDSVFTGNEVTPAIDPEFGIERSIGGAIYNIGTLTVARSRSSTVRLEGSVAIDAVTDCTLADGATPVGTDERGFARPQGASCDVGSFESVAPFTFEGFFAPLHNDAMNVMKAGRAVAVRFSLGGNKGLGVLAPGFPASQHVECSQSSDSSVIDETVAASSNSLAYDAATDVYTFLWQTETSWRNTCRDLILVFADGSTQQVRFRFHK